MNISSTQALPERTSLPRHLAIIMDGNGRWAKKRFLPRVMGHKKGLDTLEEVCRVCHEKGVAYLTVFAFSTENWRRPSEEVSFLMGLFLSALERKVKRMHANNMRLQVIGERSRFSETIQAKIAEAEALTAQNTGLTLTIAADYGGRWDIVQAANKALSAALQSGKNRIEEEDLAQYLSLYHAPEPDLFIRTGGEMRVSNFLLWQMAYAECYFTETLWPDFDESALMLAFESYQKRERRFGRTSEQLPDNERRL